MTFSNFWQWINTISIFRPEKFLLAQNMFYQPSTVLKYLYINQETKGFFFQFEIITFRLSVSFKYLDNNMGLWWLYVFYSCGARIDLRRQNLTSIIVRLLRLKSIHAPKGLILLRAAKTRIIVNLYIILRKTTVGWLNVDSKFFITNLRSLFILKFDY